MIDYVKCLGSIYIKQRETKHKSVEMAASPCYQRQTWFWCSANRSPPQKNVHIIQVDYTLIS
uniref:Uncharacterized protein n=1 Tax=Arion vulgaris TaxID=1028688 RepID=A0A0B6ZUH6_9EUPU